MAPSSVRTFKLVLLAITAAAALLVVPEIRKYLGLDPVAESADTI